MSKRWFLVVSFLLLIAPYSVFTTKLSSTISEELTSYTAYILCQTGKDSIAAKKIKIITDFSTLSTTKILATQQTILHHIALNNCLETLKAFPQGLLFLNAFINAQDIHGNTALHYAKEKKHLEIYLYLLAHGANPSLKNNEKKDAFLMLKIKQRETKK